MESKANMVKYRIIAMAAKLLAKRRFESVNLTDISREMNVDRSVVKQYFDSMEVLITAVIDTFLQNIETVVSTFIDGVLVPAISDGKLQIRKDRFRFIDQQRAAVFSAQLIDHLESLLDHLLVHRDEYLTFVQESLAPGDNHGCMERLLNIFLLSDTNPLLERVKSLTEISIAPETQSGFIQRYIFPILSFAMIKENLDQLTQYSSEKQKKKVLDDIRENNTRHIIGKDIFFVIK